MKKNNKENTREEFGVEIGDLNAIKFYEAAENAKRRESKEDCHKKEK